MKDRTLNFILWDYILESKIIIWKQYSITITVVRVCVFVCVRVFIIIICSREIWERERILWIEQRDGKNIENQKEKEDAQVQNIFIAYVDGKTCQVVVCVAGTHVNKDNSVVAGRVRQRGLAVEKTTTTSPVMGRHTPSAPVRRSS